MHVAGTPSWRVEVASSQPCELALFVRDAAALTVAGVPALLGDDPPLTDELDADLRRTAGDQWSAWWARLVDHEVRSPAPRSARHGRRAAVEALCDPPEFASLRDRPALHRAARAAFPAFGEWERARPREDAGRPDALIGHAAIARTVEDVAFDRHVDPDRLQATIGVLRLRGAWWQRVGPGAVLCSVGAAEGATTAQHLLRDAVESSLAGT